jgi:cell division protein DivIC
MQQVSMVLGYLKNKYLLSVLVFVVWISFFDRNDLLTQSDRKKELRKLETNAAYYEEQIAGTKKELEQLENDPAVLEKFARENFYLKRPEEQVFIIVDTAAQNKVEN